MSLELILNAAAIFAAAVIYVERMRADLRALKNKLVERLDAIDRRLSKLDGVPR